MSEENLKLVPVGKVHSAQGIRGDLYISIFSEEAAWLDQWQSLQLEEQQFKILKKREHQKQKRWGFVVTLEGVADRNRAEELVGETVYIPEHFLVSQEGEEIYLREVLGFRVFDATRGDVGEVVGFSGSSLQDLLVVKNSEGKYEVPFVEPILVEIDKDRKQLKMDIPLGLVAGEEL